MQWEGPLVLHKSSQELDSYPTSQIRGNEDICITYMHFKQTFIICKVLYLKDKIEGHGGRMVTLSPPTSEAGVWFPVRPQVGKLVVACRWSVVYSYRTLTSFMYWFPLPFQLPVII